MLMVVGAFAIYDYSEHQWPDVVHYLRWLFGLITTLGVFGFFTWYYLIIPFRTGFYEARSSKAKSDSEAQPVTTDPLC